MKKYIAGGSIRKITQRIKKRIKRVISNTHFTLKPVRYSFVTEKTVAEIAEAVGGIGDILRRVHKYTTMVGYARGNRLTLFKVAFSARFLVLARPFRAYMYRDNGKTRIVGSFRFSISVKIIACAWLLNDFVRLISRLREPMPSDYLGHIISLVILPVILLRTVWRDKSLQQKVIDFMKNELSASLV